MRARRTMVGALVIGAAAAASIAGPAAAQSEEIGIVWPDDPVFLERDGDVSRGSFWVTNTADVAVVVTPPAFAEDCTQLEPAAGAAVDVPPGRAAPVEIVGPSDCDALDDGAIPATATATAGATTETHVLALEREVDPGDLSLVLRLAVFLGIGLGLLVAAFAARGHVWSPLHVEADAPKSWLAGITAIGTLFTGFLGATGLLDSVVAASAGPQVGFLVVGSAIAAALLAVAGLVMGVPLRTAEVDGSRTVVVTVAQFAIGAGLTAAGAAVEAWLVLTVADRLGLLAAATAPFAVAALVIVAYSAVTIHRYVELYAGAPTATATARTLTARGAPVDVVVVPAPRRSPAGRLFI